MMTLFSVMAVMLDAGAVAVRMPSPPVRSTMLSSTELKSPLTPMPSSPAATILLSRMMQSSEGAGGGADRDAAAGARDLALLDGVPPSRARRRRSAGAAHAVDAALGQRAARAAGERESIRGAGDAQLDQLDAGAAVHRERRRVTRRVDDHLAFGPSRPGRPCR